MCLPRGRFVSVMLLLLAASLPARSEPPAQKKQPVRLDRYGDPLPEGVLARMGSGRLRHAGVFIVDALAFSPDGKSLLSGDRDRGLCIWDVASGKRIRRFEGPKGWPFAAGFSADGTTVICVGGGTGPKPIAESRVLDVASGTALKRFELRDATGAYEADVSASGKLIAMGRIDGAVQTVRLYDPPTGNEKVRIPVHGRAPRQIAFRADAKIIAMADLSDTVRIHDTANGKEIAALKRKEAVFWRTALSPDGRWAASISVDDDGNADSVIIWDLGSRKERHQIKGLRSGYCAAFSPDSNLLATGDQADFVLWDVASGKELYRCRTWHAVPRIAFSPDGKIIAAAIAEGAITLWDVATGRLMPASADPPVMPDALRFIEDGKQLLGTADVLRTWDPISGRELRRFPDVQGASRGYRSPVLSPDGTLMAADSKDGSIWLCDARAGKGVRALKGHDKYVSAYLFTPDGRKLVSAGVDKTIRVWDVASGRELHNMSGHGVLALRLVISPNGRWLAAVDSSGRGDYDIHLWDLTTAQQAKRLRVPTAWAYPVAFSPDSRFLASVGGRFRDVGGALVWDVARDKEWRTFQGHKNAGRCAAFSPDGRMLATGAWYDGAVHLWELASGKERHVFDGHECMIYSVAFSPNGRLLAASSPDAPVYVWDVRGAAPRRKALTPSEMEAAWSDLARDDAAKAYRAISGLVDVPAESVPFLKRRLRSAVAAEAQVLAQLIADLDSTRFAVRTKAAEELEKLGELAAPALRKALERKPSVEVQRRVQQLLGKLDGPITQPDALRAARSVEALEYIGNAEARELLQSLSKGAPEARLTQEAKTSLQRLAKRAVAKP